MPRKVEQSPDSDRDGEITHPVVVYAIASIPIDCGTLANWHCASSWYPLCSRVWCNSRGIFVVGFEGIEQVSYHELHEPVHLQATWCDGNREMTCHRFKINSFLIADQQPRSDANHEKKNCRFAPTRASRLQILARASTEKESIKVFKDSFSQ